MMRRVRLVCLGIIMITFLQVFSGGASAIEVKVRDSYQGSLTLANNSYDAYIISLADDRDTLSVIMHVNGNQRVDVFFCTESEYIKYKSRAPSFSYITSFSSINTTYSMFTMDAEDAPYGLGKYVFIIDNLQYTVPGASPSGDVKYMITITITRPVMLTHLVTLAIAGGAIMIGVILCVFWLILREEKRRSKKETERKPAPKQIVFCPTCALPAAWIPKYQRYYCKAEKKYLPKGIPPPLT